MKEAGTTKPYHRRTYSLVGLEKKKRININMMDYPVKAQARRWKRSQRSEAGVCQLPPQRPDSC